jgi:hypothetical protein
LSASTISAILITDVGEQLSSFPIENQQYLPARRKKMEEEQAYFSDDKVTITKTHATIDGKTYTVSDINSVRVAKRPPSRNLPITLIAIGFMSGLAAFSGESGFVYGSIAVMFLILGVLLFVSQHDRYAVQINLTSGKEDALLSRDREYVQRIVDTLNQAITERGRAGE